MTGAHPGQTPTTLTLDPADFPACREVADALGIAWERHGRTSSMGSARSAFIGVRTFLTFLTAKGVSRLSDITSDLLREFESHTATERAASAVDITRPVWTFLADLPDGALPERTQTFVKHPPALAVKKYDPTEALPDETVRAMIRAARRDITQAEHRLEAEGGYLTQVEVTAYFVLMLWELAWSMDVLKGLEFREGAQTTVLDWDAAGGDFVEVTWLKNRGGTSGVRLLRADGPWSAGTLLRRLEKATRSARALAERGDNVLTPGCPWLMLKPHRQPPPGKVARRYPVVRGGGIIVPLFDQQSPFASWLAAHEDIPVPEHLDRVTFRAIRPAAKAARITLTDSTGMTMADLVDDHTVEVYSSRYMRSQRLMRELGRIFVEDIAGRAEQVVRTWEPTIVASPTEQVGLALVPAEEAEAALSGDLEFGLTACRNPTESPMPGERSGHLCGVAFRACFTCPQAIVTPRHVDRMKVVRDIALTQRNVIAPAQWEGMWADTVAFIDKALAHLEPHAAEVEQAPSNLLDLGLRGAPSW